ncbi:hypothetical protein [Isoptericola croceus]|uniref:hypothetical protein n=1 Tax=Isoptericola croceus TaxID=3031406 RepID=UPI0023F81AA4|nr:hypothetical protein [Isoptericola croceus]
MRRRRSIAVADRTVLTIVGLALVIAGAAAVAIGAGLLRDIASPDDRLDMSGVDVAASAGWWPIAAGAAALLLILFGLWWILAHRPGTSTKVLGLPGSRSGDRLRIEPDTVAAAAESVLQDDPQVRGASLRLAEEDHALVVVGRVRVAPLADLDTVVRRVDETLGDASRVLGHELAGRVHLTVARRGDVERHVR